MSRVDAPEAAPARPRDEPTSTLVRGSRWLAASTVVVGLVNYVYSLFLTRLLTIGGYEVFAAGQALLLVVGTVSSASVPWVIAKWLARAGEDVERCRQVVWFALVANLAQGIVGAVAIGAISRGFTDTSTTGVIALGALAIFLASTTIGWLQGEERFGAMAGMRVAEVTTKVAAGVGLVLVGGGVTGALSGFMVGGAVVALIGLVVMRRDLRPSWQALRGRELWLSARGVVGVQGFVAVLASLDHVLVALLPIATAAAASYQVSMILARAPLFLAGAVSMVAFPLLSRSRTSFTDLVRTSTRLYASLVVPVTIALATMPHALLSIMFPSTYDQIGELLPYTAVTGAFIGVVNLLTTFFQAHGSYRRSVKVQALGVVWHAAALVLGWWLGGIVGFAAGSVVGALGAAALVTRQAGRVWPAALRLRTSLAGWIPFGALLVVLHPHPVAWLVVTVPIVGLTTLSALGRPPARDRVARDGRPAPGGLRILHLGYEDHRRPGSGGGSLRTHEINRRLADTHAVTVLTATWRGAEDRVEDGVEYVHIGLPLGRFGSIITYFLALPFAARRYRDADLVIEDFGAPISSAWSPLWLHRPVVAVVQWLNAREKARQYRLPFHLVERGGVRLYDTFVTVSDAMGRELREGNEDAQVAVVPNGVDARAFEVEPRTGADVVFLGRLERAQKGVDMLLDAYARIADRVEGRLVLAGDGPDRDALIRQAQRLGIIGDRVAFVGRVSGDDKWDLLASAALVAMPSRFETFGIVAAEALACGTPVLAFDLPPLREVIPVGAGHLVEPFDVATYAALLAEMLTEPEWLTAMGQIGRRGVRRLDWDELAARQEAVYLEAATGATTTLPPTESPAPGPPVEAPAPPAAPATRTRRMTATLGALARTWWLPVALAVLAIALRGFHLFSSYGIFVDEITYTRLGQSVLHQHDLLLYGSPFFLHPPGFFVLLAGYLGLLGPTGDIVHTVLLTRPVNVVLAGVSLLLLWRIVAEVSDRRAATVAAVLFAIDPFIIRINSRVLIETAAMTALLGAELLIITGMRRRGELSIRRAAAVGALFGVTLLTKEPTGFLFVVPLLVAPMLGLVRWRAALTALATAAVTYAPYPLWVLATGRIHQFADAKLTGLQRFLGEVQLTGFNAPGGGSFVGRIVERLDTFAMTYVLIGLGVPATLYLLLRGDRARRWIAVWSASTYLMAAYTIARGTLEEQLFYYLVVPSGLLTVLMAVQVLRERWRPARLVRPVAAVTLAAFAAFSLLAWARVHTTPDTSYRKLRAYLAEAVPVGARVGTTSSLATFLLDRQHPVPVHEITQVRSRRVGYLLIASSTNQASADLRRWVRTHGRVVFEDRGRSVGVLRLYELPATDVSGVPSGVRRTSS